MEKMPKNEGEQLKINFDEKEKETQGKLFYLKQELAGLCEKLGLDYMNITSIIARKLMEKYTDCRDYSYFHELVGSGGCSDKCSKADFPGGDSIYGSLTLKIIELKTIKSQKDKEMNDGSSRDHIEIETRQERQTRKNKEFRGGQWD